jgi:citrate/tricarballylate utilization protein
MTDAALLREGERIMTVCNACRYCEGYCAVFPAMEQRVRFGAVDLHYLANLCHNCGECLYACQYAPPHEFGINVPRTLAEIRLASYETYAWPQLFSSLFRRQSVATSFGLALAMVAVLLLAAMTTGNLNGSGVRADFYGVLPHAVMVAMFGVVFGFVLLALGISLARFRRDVMPGPRPLDLMPGPRPMHTDGRGTRPTYKRRRDVTRRAARDILALTYLRAHGDCTYAGEEARDPRRRWFHHCTFYGFLLCFASTSVAAVYHWLGWPAPYGYASLPVVLGAAGGWGLVVGPAGLLWIGRGRDIASTDPAQPALDRSFTVLLLLTSMTGLLLLAFRETAAMPALLLVHLGVVLALFVTLPYGKFVHGLYRAAALVKYAQDV